MKKLFLITVLFFCAGVFVSCSSTKYLSFDPWSKEIEIPFLSLLEDSNFSIVKNETTKTEEKIQYYYTYKNNVSAIEIAFVYLNKDREKYQFMAVIIEDLDNNTLYYLANYSAFFCVHNNYLLEKGKINRFLKNLKRLTYELDEKKYDPLTEETSIYLNCK